MTRPLIVLRPEPGASATAARAHALGFDARVAPLFSIRALPWQPPEPGAYDALMLTSANAVRHCGAALGRYRSLPLYVVGQATAQAAAGAGLDPLWIGGADAQALLANAAGAGVRTMLHLCGREHAAGVHPGLRVDSRAVYAAEAAIALPDALREPIVSGAVALLHSPRAAALLGQLVDEAGAGRGSVLLAALSPAVAEAAGCGWAAIGIAAKPDDNALLAVAARMCE